MPDARRIHQSLPVVDGHNDLAWALRTRTGGDLTTADPSAYLDGYATDIPRMLAGGVGGQFWSVYVPTDIEAPFDAVCRQIQLVDDIVASDARLVAAWTSDEVRAARRSGRVASLKGAEGGHAIEDDPGRLSDLRERGVRYMTLTHASSISWADSSTDHQIHGGLTDLGRRVVRRMNRLGMLVDVSHVADTTMADALAVSAAPIIASHSGARAVAPHPRNIPDPLLAAIGRQGGVVMVPFFSGFVVASTARALAGMFDTWRDIRSRLAGDETAIAAEIDRIEAGMKLDAGTVADVADHIDHIAGVAGIEGVGIGSDFDGMTLAPAGLDDVSCYPHLTAELIRRGWSEGDLRKLLGDNILRVMDAADAVGG